jgi:branched-chain amino acid transport system permease protein
MDIFIQQVFNGLSLASIFVLVSVGITLIFGLTGIVMFAHGELLMLGALVTWAIVDNGGNFFIVLPVVKKRRKRRR